MDWFRLHLAVGLPFLGEPAHVIDGSAGALRLHLGFGVVKHAAVIPVRPDWTDNRALLGYFNPLTERYVSTQFLDLLLAAREEERAADEGGRAPTPYFAILDEMNLARVEHYFSDFLSATESGEELALHSDVALERGDPPHKRAIPRAIRVPQNLHFVGTVNVDETTYMFSPKVLDRAFTLELSHVDLRRSGPPAQGDVLALTDFPGHLRPRDKPGPQHWEALVANHALAEDVLRLHDLLAQEGRHFGYRVANEIAAFVLLAAEQASHAEAPRTALDLALLQKVLPKLSGTQQELAELLDRLLAFACGEAGRKGLKGWDWSRKAGWTKDKQASSPAFPRTALKLWRMRDRLRKQGFTSYVE
jgi:5-methylcytosine-specific restriction protein B